MIAPSGEQITIAARDQQAVVVEVGGGLRSYSVGGQELLDGYRADEMSSSGRGQVLIPWPNRLQDGSYEFEGRRHQLPLNEPEHYNARPRSLERMDNRRARATPGRDEARSLSTTGLPILADS